MRALLITAGLFATAFGGTILFFASSDAGHDYDFKFVLPINTRQMPQPPALPAVVSLAQDEGTAAVTDGRAETGRPPIMPDRQPVQFRVREGAASEAAPR
jgi:hypothetical protein